MKVLRFKPCGIAAIFTLFLAAAPSASAYSVLSHEEVVDMAWKDNIVPLLQARYPGITADDLRQAHAYAYGGSVIQDIGYYPFGSAYFSDLLHYVRPNVFVQNLIRDSKTPNEYAFALGALAHFCGDTVGHPYINQVTSDENPLLRKRYGKIVTYDEDPTAHLRTEFGFDVVEVAHGHYSQENYRDFIGFQVAKPLLEKAFAETYGVPVDSIIKHEDLAIGTYRHAVSGLIPTMTKVAFVSYKNDIEAAAPGTAKSKFLYRLDQTQYAKDFGTDYTHVGIGGRVLAFVLRVVPKVGPFKALKVSVPNPQEQALYLKSVNSVVDRYKLYLAQIQAAPAPLPPPDAKDVDAARQAADKMAQDAEHARKLADKAKDPAEAAARSQVANNVQQAAEKADAAAARTAAKAQTVAAATAAGVAAPQPAGAIPQGTPIEAPTVPALPELDMDTGKPAVAGEYKLADQTYARLLDGIVNAPGSSAGPAQQTAFQAVAAQTPVQANPGADVREPAPAAASVRSVDQALATDIETFFAQPVPRVGPAPSRKEAAKESALAAQIEANLKSLRAIETTSAVAGRSTQPGSILSSR